MTGPALVPIAPPAPVTFDWLRAIVLAGVASPYSKRNYSRAFDELGKFLDSIEEPLSRASLVAYRAKLLERNLSASTINVQLSAIRQLAAEARRNGILDSETAASITDFPNVRQQGTQTGNWLSRDQAKELLAVPDQEKLIGKRDHALLALLLGCGLRRQELAVLQFEDIVEREGRAVIVDLVGTGRRVRTVAVPFWVKQSIDRWTAAADIQDGPLLRPVSKSGKPGKVALGDWSVWSVVERCAKEIGIANFGTHDLRRTCAKLCRKSGGDLEQIKFLLGHSSIQTTERYLGSEQEIAVAVNDTWSF
ncbi:phage integrase family protein (plasmid) [Acidisarcina polymorpha]|uniref:Phage integrase family protein n=1 Tax=Acidisarcina polymorpha TaxID=2211140 RepID=A0A2Z5GBM8_9BACT|nr:site-specific integrase [Acidisarcina polymorpha]AXC16360.1 phage integrase family protein [Acidisarcina polymorpha]